MNQHQRYENPLIERYASAQMSHLFSPFYKFSTWRRLWVALAEAQQALGLPISDAQIEQMTAAIDDIDFEAAAAKEKETRHDVMSHVVVFGLKAPLAKGIIHLGATSAYVADNTDLIQLREAMRFIRGRLLAVIDHLAAFAQAYKALPTLGFTHYQPAQLTTVGKRAILWLQDLVFDFQELQHRLASLAFRGVKGTTGTQASFLTLFNGDHEKVVQLDQMVSAKMGFYNRNYETGQTYPRKVDAMVLATLSGIAQSASKIATDVRLLANLKEMEEPFETSQIGSSAMAYKRNPMRCERICALSRFVMTAAQSPVMTAATQWFERTLDDSANKRLVIPESFLAVDAILMLLDNVVSGLVVYPKMIERHLQAELPFMMTENLMMEGVKKGGDRQDLHEKIRVHSQRAGKKVKQEGKDNDLLQRLIDDPEFPLNQSEIDLLTDPKLYIGRSVEQVEAFLAQVVEPLLAATRQEALASDEPRV
jgi:adenylosuccinate lyase